MPHRLPVLGALICALACVGAGIGGGSGGAGVVPDVPGNTAPRMEIVFLDVGQGDATLIRSPDGRTALIDAGPDDPTAQLEELGVERLDLVVASHPHADHIGGMEAVLDAFPFGAYMDNGQPHTTATYMSLMRDLGARDELTYLVAVPRTLTLGDVTLEVLPLPPGDDVDHNDRSIGIVVRFGRFSTLLSGDSERREVAGEVYRTDRNGRVTIFGYEDGSYRVRTQR